MKKHLRELIGQGKTKQALHKFNNLSIDDDDLQVQLVALSGRFEKYLREKHAGTLDNDKLDIELNRINAAALNLIDQLPEDTKHFVKKWRWERIALWVGILAGVVGITGYTLRDFFKPGALPTETVQPVPSAALKDTLYTKPKQGNNHIPAKNNTKNNTHIEVKDQAKVGTVITGDSNKIDIKQDF